MINQRSTHSNMVAISGPKRGLSVLRCLSLKDKGAWLLGLLLAAFFVPDPARATEDPAADHYYRGNALYNRNMHALAIEEYKLFIAKQASHAKVENARHGMALSYYAMQRYAEAEPLLKAMIANGQVGDKEQLTLLHGQCLLNLDKPVDAETVFASVIQSRSKDVMSHALAGALEAQFQQGEWTKCIATADKLLKAESTLDYQKRALYQAAYACYQLGRFAQALPYLEKLQPLVKDDLMVSQVAFLLAESYRETGKLDPAAENYAAAAAGFEGDVAADIYYRLGVVHFNRATYDDAITAFVHFLRLRKEGSQALEAQLYLGRAWLEKKDFGKAIQYLAPISEQIAPRRDPPPPEVWASNERRFATAQIGERAVLWLGRAYSRQEKYADAVNALDAAIQRTLNRVRQHNSPLMPDLYFDRANALMASGKFAGAAASFGRVLSYDGWTQMNDAMRLHAVCLHRARDYANSLTSADAFIARFKADPLASEVVFIKAENLYLLNRLDEAANVYASFSATYPEDQSAGAATFRLGQIHHKQGRWAEAARMIAPLVARQPEGQVYSQLNFIAGDCNFRLEQWEQAVSNLTVFVNAHTPPPPRDRRQPRSRPTEPNFDSALIELSLAHVNLQNPQAAMATLQTLIEQFDASVHRPLAMSELGRLQYEAGDMKAAAQTLSTFVELYAKHPQRPKVEYYLGWIALKESQLATAEQHFALVAKSYPGDSLGPDAALQAGLVQLSQKKFQEARASFSGLIGRYPEHPRMDLAIFSLGVANARIERWSEAVPHFRKITEAFAKSEHAADAVYEWAWCEKAMGRNTEAAERYRYLIETYPQSALRDKAATEMAELTYDAGRYDEAIAQLMETLSGLEDPAAKEQVLYRLGTAYFNKGDFEQSAKIFEDFVQQYPASGLRGTSLFQAGESRMKVKEMDLARGHFLAASGIGNLAPALRESVLLRLGEVQGLTRQWQESAETYKRLLATYPDSKWSRNARFGLGWALEQQGQFPQAMAAYKVVIDPKTKDLLSARAQFQIGECLFAQKKYDEAIRELVPVHTSYRFKDWAAKALLETGRIMEAKGDTAGAITQFREVLRKFPDEQAAVVAKGRLDSLRRE